MQDRVTVFTRATSWLGLPRLFKHIRTNGFALDLICVEGAFAQHSDYLDSVLALAPGEPDQTWIDSLLSYTSNNLLLGDDIAIDWLLRMCKGKSQLSSYLNDRSYSVAAMTLARNKYQLAGLAAGLGIPVPQVRLLQTASDSGALLSELGWPLVLKGAQGFAGKDVFICRNVREIRHARGALQPSSESFAQKYVTGTPLMVPAACRDGKVLSRFTAVKRATWPTETGPSTIVEIADHPVAADYVDVLVAALGLSGLVSFDFVMDTQGQYWLMECNLRPVPVSHYGGVLIDAWLNDCENCLPEGSNRLLALYPQSLMNPVDLQLFESAIMDSEMEDQTLFMAYEELISSARSLHEHPVPGPADRDAR